MYIHLRLFFKAVRLSLWESPFRLRRWVYVVFFVALYWLMWCLVAVGRGLDHVFFPGFRRQEVREPVFIVAPPRSGTTLTQKLMSLDADRFVHVKLYQTIFPAVTFQRLFDGFVGLDRLVGGPMAKLTAWAEKKWFGGWDDMHKMRFNQPEEDDGFFVYCFVTEAVFLLFPFIDELWEAGFSDALPPDERRKVMAYYKSCLQRHLYANGGGKTLLSKATQSSGSVEGLKEAFPDAKFITIIRHPYKSVASHVSVFYPVWRAHSPEIAKDSDVSRAYGRLAVEWFKHLFAFRNKVDPARYYCIDYRDLARDPQAALERLYAHFGWAPCEAFRRRLAEATQRQREFKSAHHYTLEEFGMTKEWIQKELGELLAFYELER
jgi:hypothetical protein